MRFYYSIHSRLMPIYISLAIGVLTALFDAMGKNTADDFIKLIGLFLSIGVLAAITQSLWAIPWAIELDNEKLVFIYPIKRKYLRLKDIANTEVRVGEVRWTRKFRVPLIFYMRDGTRIEVNVAVNGGYGSFLKSIKVRLECSVTSQESDIQRNSGDT